MSVTSEDPRFARFTPPGKDKPDLGLFMDVMLEDGKAWFEAQKAHTILSGSEKIGRLSGVLLIAVVSALCLTVVLFMCSVALAIWLGHRMNSLALGFLAVGGIYLALTLIFLLLWRHVLRDRITLSIINALHEKD